MTVEIETHERVEFQIALLTEVGMREVRHDSSHTHSHARNFAGWNSPVAVNSQLLIARWYGNNVADTGIRRIRALQEAIDLLLGADTPPVDRHRERGKETHIRILCLVKIFGGPER